MRSVAGCDRKHRKHRSACLDPNLVAVEFGCWPPSALNWSGAWPPAPPPNKMPTALRSSCVSPRVRPTPPLPRRWVWPNAPSSCGATASPRAAWTASKTAPSVHLPVCIPPTSRPGCWCWPVRSQPRSTRPAPARPTGASRIWPSMWPRTPNLAWAAPARAPSASSSKGTRFAWTVFDTWMNDRDPDFADKAVAIIDLLLSPPTDGPLFCVDEKPGIGVRRPTAPDQPPAPRRPPAPGRPAVRGRPARREFEYMRNGTVDLLAGFRVNDGHVCGMVRLQHRSREFCELLALLDEQTPVGQSIHLILDPVSSHWSAEVTNWLETHPQRTFVFHFLPVHASWLSFIEVWFSILSRKCLKRADFADATIATEHIEGFMTTYNTHMAHPFEWKKGVRFYKRLKDKIAARSELQQAA